MLYFNQLSLCVFINLFYKLNEGGMITEKIIFENYYN